MQIQQLKGRNLGGAILIDKENIKKAKRDIIKNYIYGVFFYILFIFVPVILLFEGKDYLSKVMNISYFSFWFYGILFFQFLCFFFGIKIASTFFKRVQELKKIITPIKKGIIVKPRFNLKGYKSYLIPLLLLGTFIGLSTVLQQLGILYFGLKENQLTVPILLTLGLPLSILLAWGLGAMEEIIFRKILQGELEKSIKHRLASIIIPILVSSLSFSLLHFQGKYSFLIFFLGMFLGVMYFLYKNIKLNMFVHAMNNIIGVILLFSTISLSSLYNGIGVNFQKDIGALGKSTYFYSLIVLKKDDKSLLYGDFVSRYMTNPNKKQLERLEALDKRTDLTRLDRQAVTLAKIFVNHKSKIK